MTRLLTAVLLAIVLLPASRGSVLSQATQSGEAALDFVDVASEAGITLMNVHGGKAKDYIMDTNGNGAAWLDYDDDGDLDALLVNGSTRENMRRGGDRMAVLYRNEGNGRFADATPGSGLDARGWGMGVCVADYDNDGRQDVYLTAYGPNVLYRNTGRGFTDVTRAAGVGDARWGMNCAFGDYDRDGDVDLYVANYLTFDEKTTPGPGALPNCRYGELPVFCGPRGLAGEADVLYRNDGNGRFTDVTAAAGIDDPGLYGFGVLFTDLNDDGWPDLFVANDSVPNQLYRNRQDGTFAEEGLVSGVAFSADGREQASMGVDAGDYNGDGRLDLIVTNFSGDYSTLYENLGGGLFTDVTQRVGMGVASLPYLKWGVGLVDADNDADLDVFVANGHVYPSADRSGQGTTFLQPKQLFRNDGGRRFEDVTRTAGSGLLLEKSSRGAAFGDYDNDGDIDVLVLNLNDRPSLLRNDTRTGNHWVTIRLEGTRSNRDGIGARIRLRAGGRTQTLEVRSGGSYLSHNDIRAHAGLGAATRIDSIEIRWPSGAVDVAKSVAVDRFYVAEEGNGLR